MEYNKEYFKNILPKRPENSHKGTFGHVLNVAGCASYPGAAYFSSLAPSRVGCGRVTLASVEAVLRSVSCLTPDVILMPLAQTEENTIAFKAISQIEKVLGEFQAVSVGCGISLNKDTGKFFGQLMSVLAGMGIPVVVDADGLNLLSKSTQTILSEKTILTPHPKELSRLMCVDVEEILSKPDVWAKKCCEKYGCTVVLKTHKTIVVNPQGHIYKNNTGNTALSHGGSGDVLCGMITGFLACGLNSFEASVLGVYLHGLAAELASADLTEYSVLSSDLLKYIPFAIKTII